MYLIFKRLNPTSVILFNSLDEIKEATETEVYGKYISDETRSSGTENNYSNFIRQGANLTDEQKDKFREISTELSKLSLKFNLSY